jgi:hypothetical protein
VILHVTLARVGPVNWLLKQCFAAPVVKLQLNKPAYFAVSLKGKHVSTPFLFAERFVRKSLLVEMLEMNTDAKHHVTCKKSARNAC